MTFLHAPRAVVVDASSTVEMLGEDGRWVDRFARWIVAGAQLVAPGHFRLEVANALLKGRRLEPLVAMDGVRRLFALGIGLSRDDPDALATTIELAVRHNLTVYDAAYVQLALDLDAELATQDRAMAKAARAEGLVVHD